MCLPAGRLRYQQSPRHPLKTTAMAAKTWLVGWLPQLQVPQLAVAAAVPPLGPLVPPLGPPLGLLLALVPLARKVLQRGPQQGPMQPPQGWRLWANPVVWLRVQAPL